MFLSFETPGTSNHFPNNFRVFPMASRPLAIWSQAASDVAFCPSLGSSHSDLGQGFPPQGPNTRCSFCLDYAFSEYLCSFSFTSLWSLLSYHLIRKALPDLLI